MPKLNEENAKQAQEASDGFEPLDPAAYHVRLVDVDADRPPGPKGPYWSWEFNVVEPGEYLNRKLWNNTSLSKDAAFGLKMTFDAFEVPTDTDTDDLLGKVVKAVVSIRTIQEGPRKGQLANQIDRLSPADEGFEAPEVSSAGESPNPEEVFG